MAKKDTELRQVATRVTADTLEVLQVALFLERAESMQELLRPVVEDYARGLMEQREVKAILDEADGYRARKAGVRRLGSSADPR